MQKSVNNLVQKGKMLPLMEEFYTIQGEGYHSGKAAYFIRIGGCDVGCHWCDVKESWNPDLHPPTSIEHIAENAANYSNQSVINESSTNIKFSSEVISKLNSLFSSFTTITLSIPITASPLFLATH